MKLFDTSASPHSDDLDRDLLYGYTNYIQQSDEGQVSNKWNLHRMLRNVGAKISLLITL